MVKRMDRGDISKQAKGKSLRTTDDLELLKIILEDNPRLRLRVLNFLAVSLGKIPPTDNDDLRDRMLRLDR